MLESLRQADNKAMPAGRH